ncbi:restriction endonuclease [Streptomyces sp. NPDC085900]|uniref:restriction endonuclease n=1 Tax=Streptomyces sp. NPDC085900 TaxID=3365737 RepID=UPI0037CD534E
MGNQSRITVAVLESDNNKRGDLFGRAMQDLFHSLGYGEFALNVHRAGREIDIKGKHRTENRTLIAECKATKAAVGGADTNKFAGAVQAERIKNSQATAYFVSLGGFTAPAREQEEEAGHRMTLLDGARIADELVRGRVVVERSVAAAVAGTCPDLPSNAKLGDRAALLVHEIGWIWAFFFKVSGKYSYFTLVHADGYGLHQDLADEVIDSDSTSSHLFSELQYVKPSDVGEAVTKKQEAIQVYFSYLEREFGGITLEGLPADQEVGSKAIRLESLYVPLHLNPIPRQDEVTEVDPEEDEAPVRSTPDIPKKAVSEVLQSTKHVAILAAPGGGKTTLLKRLAVAYAANDRRGEVADELPAEDWFPIFIRCRQLGASVRSPITEIIHNTPRQAERADLLDPFQEVTAEALKAGKVLLLVDGLDEISDGGNRAAFAAQLRTFIGTYPATRVIVTSREAGFRVVSGAMSAVCSLYRIADLSNPDIYTLCRAWQHEVVGGPTETANKLAHAIVSKPRVRDLAINPLLLTTLLLVQRWLGELPQKRSVLYDKAIEVLLMTWNREGHDPIDREEAMPQLAYAAFSMMRDKRQSISAKGLKDLFDEARATMPEVLAYARMSSTDLIERVEERSSLLVQSGHILESGQLRPLYEFKHLTFQEYLAAQACVESWNPLREEVDDYSAVLDPYLDDESWAEVVPLAAVLAGSRGARKIVKRLLERLQETKNELRPPRRQTLGLLSSPAYANLMQCIVDEVQITPQLVREVIDKLIVYAGIAEDQMILEICQSKFAEEISTVAWDGYKLCDESMMRYGSALASYSLWEFTRDSSLRESINSHLSSAELREACIGASVVMTLSFMHRTSSESQRSRRLSTLDLSEEALPSEGDFSTFKSSLLQAMQQHEQSAHFCTMAAWAIAWMGSLGNWQDEEIKRALEILIRYWREGDHVDTRRMAAWGIWSLPLASPGFDVSIPNTPELKKLVTKESRRQARTPARDNQRAAAVVAYYAGWVFDYTEKEQPGTHNDVLSKEWYEKLATIEATH